MRIISDLDTYNPDPSKPLILILGNFDGLHQGHRQLIQRGLDEAKRENGRVALFTFREHPQQVLHPSDCPKLLTTVEHKMFLIEQMGVRDCFLLHFTKEFSEQEPEAFVEEVLIRKLHVHEVCLGYNARFGHGRKGDIGLMRELSAKLDFRFEETPPHRVRGEVVSSSRVRQWVEAGDLERARECLDRPYSLYARVVKGDGVGGKLGFPTANLEISRMTLPPHGVYPVRVRLIRIESPPSQEKGMEQLNVCPNAVWHQGVLNYGFRPTISKSQKEAAAEVHLLDFTGNLYDQYLEVEFHKRLRPEKRFENPQALKSQILADIEDARKALKGQPLQKGTSPL